VQGDLAALNTAIANVRLALGSTDNPYWKDTILESVEIASDPETQLKEFVVKLEVQYLSDVGGV
jgi:hypothetical protein